eukprot:TRINITY_DN5251_c0_g1_i1.p1 TRINITY_DN5251_c0_g1~~TRINITY_DN5251_c0_g1_i1.p1  ORF type:complete len:1081 (+),score=191.83 TRINITY_DN5251_c0_g1_i1:439-3681(+)
MSIGSTCVDRFLTNVDISHVPQRWSSSGQFVTNSNRNVSIRGRMGCRITIDSTRQHAGHNLVSCGRLRSLRVQAKRSGEDAVGGEQSGVVARRVVKRSTAETVISSTEILPSSSDASKTIKSGGKTKSSAIEDGLSRGLSSTSAGLAGVLDSGFRQASLESDEEDSLISSIENIGSTDSRNAISGEFSDSLATAGQLLADASSNSDLPIEGKSKKAKVSTRRTVLRARKQAKEAEGNEEEARVGVERAEPSGGEERREEGAGSAELLDSDVDGRRPGGVSNDDDAGSSSLPRAEVLTVRVGDRDVTLETGRIGRQASGAILIRDGDTIVYTTVCASNDEGRGDIDFLPLSVNYQERFSAAGRTSGGFFKREGKQRDNEILVSRLIDRPLRPMVAKGFCQETQILLWVMSYDGEHAADALSITAAGAAMAISEVPLLKPVAGVRVGLCGDEFVVNPTVAQMDSSRLDMIVAGTADAVLMIEGYCEMLPERDLLKAVEVGQEAIAGICKAVGEWAAKVGKQKWSASGSSKAAPALKEQLQSLVGKDLAAALQVKSKHARGERLYRVERTVLEMLGRENGGGLSATAVRNFELDDEELAEKKKATVSHSEGSDSEDEDEGEALQGRNMPALSKEGEGSGDALAPRGYSSGELKQALKELSSETMRRLVVMEGVRSDGRGPRDVRPISSSCGLLPRVHGSALFTRGETQALAVATLGGEKMSQRQDYLTSTEEFKRFYLQYTFPPSSVGEAGKFFGQSRREVGHGTLAERALAPSLPDEVDFPYTVRVESTITESNGSSSMASVCGGCLAMQDAGVPLKTPLAGVAMGLILDTKSLGGSGEPLILSDILGSEDALGDMDFKVAGSAEGVTAFQMDIKVEGITIDVMERALAQAREARCHILAEMAKCDPPPVGELSEYAPRIVDMKIPADKVKEVIGGQGKVIRALIESTGVDTIDIEDSGQLRIVAKDLKGLHAAQKRIQELIMVPEINKIYRNCPVKSIAMFGAFVEIIPGKEGLCHISELGLTRLTRVEDAVKEGDLVDVKVLEITPRGQMRLSRKAVLLEEQAANGTMPAPATAGAPKSP